MNKHINLSIIKAIKGSENIDLEYLHAMLDEEERFRNQLKREYKHYYLIVVVGYFLRLLAAAISAYVLVWLLVTFTLHWIDGIEIGKLIENAPISTMLLFVAPMILGSYIAAIFNDRFNYFKIKP